MDLSIPVTGHIRTLVMESGSGGIKAASSWLRQDPDIELLGEYSDGVVSAVLEKKPEFLFLDAEAQGIGDDELLCTRPDEKMPVIVLAAGDEHHALRAFQIHALDFLLKPFDHSKFQNTLRRVKCCVHERRLAEINGELLAHMAGLTAPAKHLNRLMVKSGSRIMFLKATEIDWLEAQGDYVRLYACGKKHLLREKISDLEHQLPPGFFVRIHRSVIVNIDRIREMQPLLYGECAVILLDGTRLTLSRSYRDKVFDRFSRAC
jgi:two-component system LytT family response regulator